ncbi:MAG: hypothetical protein KGZ35_04915 [Truepera sp.]|nr:hypothetical protein [Truepera sp.]
MRNLYAYRATYLIAALIVAAAALFAWLRSQERVVAPEEAGYERLYEMPAHPLWPGSLSSTQLLSADPKRVPSISTTSQRH